MGLGDRIEERRAELGLTKAELARRAEVPQTTLSSIVARGSRSSPHLVRLARALETTPAYLLGESNDPVHEFEVYQLTREERELVKLAPWWIATLRCELRFDQRA